MKFVVCMLLAISASTAMAAGFCKRTPMGLECGKNHHVSRNSHGCYVCVPN